MQPEQLSNRRLDRVLEVLWGDGARQVISHRQLRAACRCTHCHSARLRDECATLRPDLQLDEIRPVGHYAVQLVFSDGHDRGIYPWELLRNLENAVASQA